MHTDSGASSNDKTFGWDGPWAGITRTLLVVVALLSYLRLFIGVDVTDESFYNSLPYSFVLGFRPYRDELNLAQNAGILLTPFFKAYYSLFGSTGLVLFNRHLYFLLLSLCSYLSFRVGFAYVNRNFGRLLAAFTLTYSYFNIPSISYNTLGSLSLFGGLFLLLIHAAPVKSTRPHRFIFGANCCFGLSAFCYPSLLLSSVAGIAASLWLSNRPASAGSAAQTRLNRVAWAASLATGAVGALGFLVYFGIDGISDVLAEVRDRGSNPIDSFSRSARIIGLQFRQLQWYLVGFAGLVLLPILPARSFASIRWPFVWAVMAGTTLILFLIQRQPSLPEYPAGSAPLLLSVGLMLPVVLALLPDRRRALQIALVIGVPCFGAAFAISFSSMNRLPSATLGLFPAAATCLLCVAMIASSIDRMELSNRVRLASAMGAFTVILGFQSFWLLQRSYGDSPFAPNSRLAFGTGPFAGLLTTQAKVDRLAALTADLNSLRGKARSLFVYEWFPAGYLLTNLKPRTFSTWIFWPSNPQARAKLIRRVFESEEPAPDIVLQVGWRPVWVDDEVRRLRYKVHIERREFEYALLLREDI